jgi:hypothetical protein
MSLEWIRTHDAAVLAETNPVLMARPTHLISGSVKWPEPSHENPKYGKATDCSQEHGLFSQDQQAVSDEHAHREIQKRGKSELFGNSQDHLYEQIFQLDALWSIAGLFVQAALESGRPSWSLSYGPSVPIIEHIDVRKPKSVPLPSSIHQLTPQCVVDRVR